MTLGVSATRQTLPMTSDAITAAAAAAFAYEETLDDTARRRGAHYTPPDVAAGLVERALGLLDRSQRRSGRLRVVDLSCGGGVFLAAVAEALVVDGMHPTDALASVWGYDCDPGAVTATIAALSAWAGAHDVDPTDIASRIEVGDGLEVEPQQGGWDLVVGNPPFQAQLYARTARDDRERARISRRFGTAARGYVDTAGLFLLHGVSTVVPGGVVAMIQPRSILSTKSASVLRRDVLRRAALAEMWLPETRVFEGADVDVCAPLLVVGDGGTAGPSTVLLGGRDAVPTGSSTSVDRVADSWSTLLAVANGVPEVSLRARGRVEDLAVCTAGFRDQFYALLAHTRDEQPLGAGARLVTSGIIDPATLGWGEKPVRFGKRTWQTPWLDVDLLEAIDPQIHTWVSRLSKPKVLVATQTRAVEAVVDVDGSLVPVTPVIAVVPDHMSQNSGTWMLAAALTAPPVAAWLHMRLAGSGMSAGALRLTAKALAQVPLPRNEEAWVHGAGDFELLQRQELGAAGTWREFGTTMCEAYEVDPGPLVDWWLDRLPASTRAVPD